MTSTQTATATVERPVESFKVKAKDTEQPEWLTDLWTKGWTVVREAIRKDKALKYAEDANDWLESWGLGYNRNDPTTRRSALLPFHHRGGIYARHGIGHEQFVWDLKSEPSLVDKYAQIWGTDELLVSYDGLNLSIPESARPKTDVIFQPWAHVDQSPLRTNLQCVQGIVNLLPNGPEDGGLMILDGSSRYYAELWQHFDHKKGENGWNKWEQQFLDEEMCQWLESKGCKWVKVCAQPGDLLLWDSRTVHYGAPPSSTNNRFAAYVCYKPAAVIDEETKRQRLEVFEKKQGTTHDPSVLKALPRLPPEDCLSYELAKQRPLQQPVLSKLGRQLCGLDPY